MSTSDSKLTMPTLKSPSVAKHHAIDAALDERFMGELIGPFNPCRAIGRSAGFQAIDGFANLVLLISGGGLEHRTRASRVHHHGHAIPRGELIREQSESVLQQRQLHGRLHRAGHIDQEHQVRGRAFVRFHLEALDADAQEPRFAIPWRRRKLCGDAEGRAAIGRRVYW